MAPSLRLHVRVDVRRTTLVFGQFPVRIGREVENECRLEFPFVSRYHARIELKNGALLLIDEGSRLGMSVRSGTERVAPHGRVQLSEVGGEFQIGAISVVAELVEEPAGASRRDDVDEKDDARRAVERDALYANATRNYAVDDVHPEEVDADALRAQLRRLIEDERHAWIEARHDIAAALESIDPSRRRALLERLLDECPWLLDDREVRRWGREMEIAEPSSPSLVSPDAQLALQGLTELAASYVPFAPPLAGADAVVAFVARLDLVLRTLLEGVAALRVAHDCETGVGSVAPLSRLDLGAYALDWTNAEQETRAALERIFSDVLTHHSRLVNEVGACMNALAPKSIEARHEPRAIDIFRYRALWRAYAALHDELLGSGAAPIGSRFARVVAALDGVEWRSGSESPRHEESEPAIHAAGLLPEVSLA